MARYGNEVLMRLMAALDIPDQHGAKVKLARRLGISKSTLGEWQRRNQIGWEVLDVCNEEDIDANWVMFGKDVKDVADLQIVDVKTPTDEIMELDQIAKAIRNVRRSIAARKGSG